VTIKSLMYLRAGAPASDILEYATDGVVAQGRSAVTDCAFCGAALESSSSPFDTIIARSQWGRLVPAVGMMVQGYFLVVTEEHLLSMSQAEPQLISETYLWADSLTSRLEMMFGKYMIVEHGSCSTSSSGACIDHAHLHLVPLADRVGQRLLSDSTMKWKYVRDVSTIAEQRDAGYVTLRIDGQTWLSNETGIPSQWLRRQLAVALNQEIWDWALAPREATLRQTLDKLRENRWITR